MAELDNREPGNEVPASDADTAQTIPVDTPAPIKPAPISSLEALAGAARMPSAEAEGNAAEAEAQREKATIFGTVKAGVSRWIVPEIYEAATMPDFAPGNLDVGSAVLNTPIQLSEAEREYLMANKSRSIEEHEARLQRLTGQREVSQALGDNPVTGFLAQGLDPGWMLLDLVSAGASRIVRGGRLARTMTGFTTAAAGTVAIDAAISEVRPMSVSEIIADALVNGAATALFLPKNSRVPRKIDPTFPDTDLNQVARDVDVQTSGHDVVWEPKRDADGRVVIKNGVPVLTPTRRPDFVDSRAATRDIPEVVAETARVPEWRVGMSGVNIPAGAARSTVSQGLRQAIKSSTDPLITTFLRHLSERLGPAADKMPMYTSGRRLLGSDSVVGYYNPADNSVTMKKGVGEFALAHEVAHAATTHKIDFGLKNPNTAHGRIVRELEDLRKAAQAGFKEHETHLTEYLGSNIHEFVAGLFTGDKGFMKALSELPAPGTPNKSTLGKLIDGVRRLLGFPAHEMNGFLKALQLTDDLIDQPLKVVYSTRGKSMAQARKLQTTEGTAKLVDEDISATIREGRAFAPAWVDKFEWSLSKSMRENDPDVGRILLDDPLNPSHDTVDSFVRSNRAQFAVPQRVFEDLIRAESAARGATLWSRIFSPAKAKHVQSQVEAEVRRELDRRNRYFADNGTDAPRANGIPDNIYKAADASEEVYNTALDRMKRDGVEGADTVPDSRGYYSRKWDAPVLANWENRLLNSGLDEKQARAFLNRRFAEALKRVNPGWDDELAADVGAALVARTRRKGDFTDTAFRGHMGNEALAEVRDSLSNLGIPSNRMQRVMDLLSGKIDEANRASFMKSKLDIDLDFEIRFPDGSKATIGDMIQSNMVSGMDRYLDEVAGRSAFAAKGLGKESDIANLKARMVRTMQTAHKGSAEIERAGELFDDTINMLHGRGVGTNFAPMMRLMQGASQMMGLGASGIWQLTEYAKMTQRYGISRTLQYARRSWNFQTDIKKMSPADLSSLNNILARNAFQEVRLRPYLERMEDGFDFPTSSKVMHVMQQMKQLVPYINGMKYIQHHQSNLAGNLITDTLVRGARGDTKFLEVLEGYGIDLNSPLMGQVRQDVANFGADTSKWADETFEALRTGLDRMMDDAVLRTRRGEMPAFVQTNDVGKFLFTFRSFVLGAHNKTLLGTANRDGMAGLTLLLAYQYPLALIAVQANSWSKGRDLTDDELMKGAVAQMGGIGLFSEMWNVVTGGSQEFGTPGLIGLDRMYRFAGAAASLDGRDTAAALLNAIPLLPIIQGTGKLQELIKDD